MMQDVAASINYLRSEDCFAIILKSLKVRWQSYVISDNHPHYAYASERYAAPNSDTYLVCGLDGLRGPCPPNAPPSKSANSPGVKYLSIQRRKASH